MKNFVILFPLSLLVLALLSSCEEDELDQPSQSQTDFVPAEMSFEMNGESFNATRAYLRDHDSNRMSVFCENELGSSFYFSIPDFHGVATYELLEVTDVFKNHAKLEIVENGDTAIYRAGPSRYSSSQASNIGKGLFSFDSLDTDANSYSGAFSVTLRNVLNVQDTVQITNGIFRNLRVHDDPPEPPTGGVGLWMEGRYYIVDDFDIRISGARYLIGELRDNRLPGLDRMRIQYPLEQDPTSNGIIWNSAFTVALDSSEVGFLHGTCTSGSNRAAIEWTPLGQTVSGRLVSGFYLDIEVIFNEVQLTYLAPPGDRGKAQLLINGETIVFDEIEASFNQISGQTILFVSASNSEGQSFFMGSTLYNQPFQNLGAGYTNYCSSTVLTHGFYNDGLGGESNAIGLWILTEDQNGDGSQSIQFQSLLDLETDMVFGIDSIVLN